MSAHDEQERGLLGLLDRMLADGKIVSYRIEATASSLQPGADRQLVVKLVPRKWVEHVELARLRRRSGRSRRA